MVSWQIAKHEQPDSSEMISKENDKFVVVVEEKRKFWNPAIGDFSEESKGLFVFEVVRGTSQWLIDKYYWQSAKSEASTSLKYQGLGF